jgi:hypothetical protein
MRLLIDTRDVKFRVAGLPKARPDYRDKDKQARTSDQDGNRPITVRVQDALAERSAPAVRQHDGTHVI